MPTQTTYPWKAVLRTIVAAVIGLGSVLPIAWVIVQEELGAILSPEVMARIGVGVTVALAVTGAITRVMAIPAVNDWLTRLGLGAEPKAEVGAGWDWDADDEG